MKYTVKTNGRQVAQVAHLVDACEVAIFISKKEYSEAYVYDGKILIARAIGDVITVFNRNRFKQDIGQSVTKKE